MAFDIVIVQYDVDGMVSPEMCKCKRVMSTVETPLKYINMWETYIFSACHNYFTITTRTFIAGFPKLERFLERLIAT